ncbi:MAG: hypothetical protein HQ564_06665 [Candidatus Saganbacteria bacterium]|nr:hypothetical protein [Candidatus Saganbacteria bacterium]
MFSIQLDWTSVLVGMTATYLVYSLITFYLAYRNKKKAEREMDKIEGKIKKVEEQLKIKKQKLEDEINKRTKEK